MNLCFHCLSTGWHAIGMGNTFFSALAVVSVDPKFGATEITAPGADIGCYRTNGIGNQH